jgi:hypothetical protein
MLLPKVFGSLMSNIVNQYYSKLMELLLDRPLPESEESIRCAELDVLWNQLTTEEQSEIEERISQTPGAEDSLNMIDRVIKIDDSILPRIDIKYCSTKLD